MLLLRCQLLLQVEVSNTSNWADAAFVTGSGKRIKAVLLHQVNPQRSAEGNSCCKHSHTQRMQRALRACSSTSLLRACQPVTYGPCV